MVARVVGARRAALVVDEPTRSVTVAVGAEEAEDAGRPLASWLDAHAPRSAARRAASPAAPIRVVRARRDGAPARPDGDPAGDATFFVIPVSGVGGVHLGVELPGGAPTAAVTARLPPSTYRHILAALAVASARAADERQLAELRSRDAERAGFMSMVAHELRTPLTSIGGYLDLLLEGRVSDPGVEREFLERSRRIADGMAELVGDLLEMSRIEAGSLGLKIEQFSLAEACAHVLEGLEPLATRAGIRLVRALPPRLRPATGDRRRVEQILTNLVANAIKFTPHGGLVELEASTGPTTSIVVVRDDGPGIAIEDRVRIFEPFVRVEGNARIAGTGLGLPIARDLARAMRGELGAASVPGSDRRSCSRCPEPQRWMTAASRPPWRLRSRGRSWPWRSRPCWRRCTGRPDRPFASAVAASARRLAPGRKPPPTDRRPDSRSTVDAGGDRLSTIADGRVEFVDKPVDTPTGGADDPLPHLTADRRRGP